MGSRRKKLEKKRDFQKQRLRVGKSAPKASNHTDTSFTAKSIHVPLQSVLKTKTDAAELAKNISLTKHNTPQVRKEAVLFLTKHLDDYPTMTKSVVNAVAKLAIDESSEVRTATEKLLRGLLPVALHLNYNTLILYAQSAMTHINTSVRNDLTKFLSVLIDDAGCAELTVNGHWIKLLKAFFSLLHWQMDRNGVQLGGGKAARAARLRHLKLLDQLVVYGCEDSKETRVRDVETLHIAAAGYLQPLVPGAFDYLQLFKRSLDDASLVQNDEVCEDMILRRKKFVEMFASPMERELKGVVKEGGEAGRLGKNLLLTVERVINEENTYRDSIGEVNS